MTEPRRIAVIAGGLSQPSSTRLLADRLAEATARGLAAHAAELATAILASRRVRGPADPFALPQGFSPVGAYGETR